MTRTDPLIAQAIASEMRRQHDVIELIASENIVSRAVLDVQGSILTNKTVEGYPGKRYHAGAVNVDAVERAAIERACQLFGCRFANVQPHSGSQANHAVLHAVADARRHHPEHGPERRRPPEPRRGGQLQRQVVQGGELRRARDATA